MAANEKTRSLFRSRALRIFAFRIILGAIILGFWQYASGRLISDFWVSSPAKIFKHFVAIVQSGIIFGHVSTTFYEAFVGYILGAVIGIISGFVLANMEVVAKVIDPYIMAFYGVPRIALAPLFIIWFGIGILSKVILVVTVVYFLTFFNTYSGVKGVDLALKNIARVMGAKELQILTKVTIPASIPWIVTGLKVSVPYALTGAIVGEFIAASKGLGYMIQLDSNLFNTTGAMTGIFILMFIVIAGNEILNRMEAYILRWRPKEKPEEEAELY